MNPVNDVAKGARPLEMFLTMTTRVVGVCAAIVVCGVGADVAYRGNIIGHCIIVASAVIFFLEIIIWAVALFVRACECSRSIDESRLCCSNFANGNNWRRTLLYLPIACFLAWKPHKLWLSYVAAGLLALLALLHIALSAFYRGVEPPSSPRSFNGSAIDSVGESLLHCTRSYDRFDQVTSEVFEDGMAGMASGGRMGWMLENNGDI